MHIAESWYVVYTKPRWEKKVAELLTKKGIENYCPLNRVKKQWHDRKKIVLEPLFTSYVFVSTNSKGFNSVLETSGIINFVHWLGRPAIVKHEEIETIKSFMTHYENVQLERIDVNVNDRVKIVNGPLINREGNVIEVLNRSLKISLPSLGYMLVATIEKTNVEKVHMAPVTEVKSSVLQ